MYSLKIEALIFNKSNNKTIRFWMKSVAMVKCNSKFRLTLSGILRYKVDLQGMEEMEEAYLDVDLDDYI